MLDEAAVPEEALRFLVLHLVRVRARVKARVRARVRVMVRVRARIMVRYSTCSSSAAGLDRCASRWLVVRG